MNCAVTGCVVPTSGASKYCRPHAKEARERWLAMIREKSAARDERTRTFAGAWFRACDAAKVAHKAAEPTPMVVVEKNVVTGEDKQRWFVSEGCCGYASVSVVPGNHPFAIWAKKNAGFRKSYKGGCVSATFSYGSQSYERSCAAADAAVAVLREAGIPAYVDSWID
jgi:hypothetical protein